MQNNQTMREAKRFFQMNLVLLSALLAAGCVGTGGFAQVIPTERPTATATYTPTATRTPGFNSSPTPRATTDPLLATFGPSPTSLLGATNTPDAVALANLTPTRVVNPNAPRIEFFTANPSVVAPGEQVTLFWSSRNVETAIIYRLDGAGARVELFNVAPDGSLPISTRRGDRGELNFVLSVGEGALRVEQRLTVALACPVAWFFQPPPSECADADPAEEALIEQPFERGRMVYVASSDVVYTLFNDGQQPAWVAFNNRYDPTIHPASEPAFDAALPEGRFQPVAILGFVWRGNDTARVRLGVGIQPEAAYQGFTQTYTQPDGGEVLYLSSADGTVLQLLPGRAVWQIISPQ